MESVHHQLQAQQNTLKPYLIEMSNVTVECFIHSYIVHYM